MLSYHQYHSEATLYHMARRTMADLTVSPVPCCQVSMWWDAGSFEGRPGSFPAQALFSTSGM